MEKTSDHWVPRWTLNSKMPKGGSARSPLLAHRGNCTSVYLINWVVQLHSDEFTLFTLRRKKIRGNPVGFSNVVLVIWIQEHREKYKYIGFFYLHNSPTGWRDSILQEFERFFSQCMFTPLYMLVFAGSISALCQRHCQLRTSGDSGWLATQTSHYPMCIHFTRYLRWGGTHSHQRNGSGQQEPVSSR
jgi:hypothetical protein